MKTCKNSKLCLTDYIKDQDPSQINLSPRSFFLLDLWNKGKSLLRRRLFVMEAIPCPPMTRLQLFWNLPAKFLISEPKPKEVAISKKERVHVRKCDQL